jgi:large conductance mechanosensitive channel
VKEFREFLLKQNALALAIGVIIGAAIGKVVTSIVSDLLMPVIGMAMPGGEWRNAQLVLSKTTDPTGKEVVNAVKYGAFFGNVVDFVIVAFVVYMIGKALIKPEPPAAAPATKTCPACLETVPAAATRCRACTGAV